MTDTRIMPPLSYHLDISQRTSMSISLRWKIDFGKEVPRKVSMNVGGRLFG